MKKSYYDDQAKNAEIGIAATVHRYSDTVGRNFVNT